jgi:hypothetical protein
VLCLSSLQMMCGRDGIYEYYYPEIGEKPLEVATVFGCSSSILIDMAIKESLDNKVKPSLK